MYCTYSTVIPRDRFQGHNGIEVIDLDGDATATMLSVPMESEEIMNSLTSHKSEVREFDGIYQTQGVFHQISKH